MTRAIKRIAIIGTGVIGASWAALFLAKDFEVVATDVAPDADASLKNFIKAAWPATQEKGPLTCCLTVKSEVYGGSGNCRKEC